MEEIDEWKMKDIRDTELEIIAPGNYLLTRSLPETH